jgi:hypothetical protein
LPNKVHPEVVLDDVDEVIEEPNFNNYNTSPEPPSPYADLEKKYRKNRFNKGRSKNPSEFFSVSATASRPASKSADGNKLQQKRKPKKKTSSKVYRSTSGKRNA